MKLAFDGPAVWVETDDGHRVDLSAPLVQEIARYADQISDRLLSHREGAKGFLPADVLEFEVTPDPTTGHVLLTLQSLPGLKASYRMSASTALDVAQQLGGKALALRSKAPQ